MGERILAVNAPVPFHQFFPEGLRPGQRIFIRGLTIPGGDQFAINLVTNNGDIALHFNPRFNESQIVRNSCIASEWGPEERFGPFPFQENYPFDFYITVESDHFTIAMDGSVLFDYNFRISLDQVTQITIGGVVQINKISLID